MTEPVRDVTEVTTPDGSMPRAELARQAIALCRRRWCPHLLYALADGPMRFNELARAVPRVSGKVLTETLHALEGDRLIRRDAGAYELTRAGRNLLVPVSELAGWAARYRAEIRLGQWAKAAE